MMTKRIVGATLLGLLVSIPAVAASCSFPSYTINVTTGAGGGATASSSGDGTGGVGGFGGAPSTTSVTSSSTTSVTSSGDTTSATSSSSATSSASSSASSTSSGPCTTDADGDGSISWECSNGDDCADQDKRAHPGADFTVGVAIQGPTRAGTLPYDFNCDLTETKQTMTLNCAGLCVDASIKGFKQDVDCGSSAPLGHCGGLPCAWISDSANKTQVCK